MASAAMLFIKAELTTTKPHSAVNWRARLSPTTDIPRATQSATPVFCNPRLTTSSEAIVTTAGCPNPEKASSKERVPNRMSNNIPIRATKS